MRTHTHIHKQSLAFLCPRARAGCPALAGWLPARGTDQEWVPYGPEPWVLAQVQVHAATPFPFKKLQGSVVLCGIVTARAGSGQEAFAVLGVFASVG